MPDESQSYSDVCSRRRFVQLAGATGAAALAGCSGDGSSGTEPETDGASDGDGGDGGGDEPSETEGTTVHDVRHLSSTNQAPDSVQFNPWGPNQAQIANEVFFDKFANFNYAKGEYEPGIVSEWEFTGDAFEMTIQEGATWHDGDAVTSEDFATYLRLDKHMGSAIWDWGGEVQTPDERTVVITVEDDVNPSLVEFAVMENELRTKRDVYGDILDQLDENPDDTSPLTEFTDPDPVGNGIFEPDQADEQMRLTQRFADHPNADNVNFQEYAFKYVDGNTASHQALKAVEVESMFDAYVPPSVVEALPDSWRRYLTPVNTGLGIVPNHTHKDLGKRAVRQAVAYVLDRETIANNSDPNLSIPEVPTALPTAQQEIWLGDAMDDFETYGRSEQRTDEAASVLEDAGYTQNGDTWEDENGDPLSFEIIAPGGWSNWVTPMETAADQLSAFGMDVTFNTRPFSQLNGADGDWAQGEYDATAENWTAAFARAAHPYFNTLYQMVNPGAMLRAHGYNYPGAIEDRGGSAADVTVPARDGDGELTVNPVEDVEALGTTSDTDEEETLALDLLWVSNQDLPMIPIQEGNTQSFLNAERWDVPAEDADAAQVKYVNTWLPRQGDMQYSGD